jgi:5-methylcytosine-specific restriction protein B
MREPEFREWLGKRLWKGNPLTKKAKDNRVRRSKRGERGLNGLGFEQATLEAVYAEGQWDALITRLSELKNDESADLSVIRSVVPQSDDPSGQLTNMIAALKQYGYFLEGRDPNYGTSNEPADGEDTLELTRDSVEAAMTAYDLSASDFMQKYGFATNFDYVVFRPGEEARFPAKAIFLVAYSSIPGNPDLTVKGQRDTFGDAEGGPIHSEFVRLGYEVESRRRLSGDEAQAERIRKHLISDHIEPAKRRNEATVTIRAGDVHKELGLSNQLPNVCQAIEGKKLRDMTGLAKPEILSGPESGRGGNMTYRFALAAGSHPKDIAVYSPSNLILYGPPGTGKTYRTALEAVKLCDGDADYPETPAGRAALMGRYRELEAEKRIAFVTFHQNYDYETFVEGLRPETGDAEGGSVGFRLEARAGIFREICALADQARTRTAPSASSAGYDFSGRRFWKMGQGAIGTEDEVYDAAIANNYITLGWGGSIDWSSEEFSTFEAIKAEWLAKNPDDTTPSNWTQTWPFRCEMKVGDIVIVPYGNTAFRAIAEVTGDYRFEPSAEGYYAHRRNVRWLLTLDEPLPLDTIVDGNFTMRTLYSVPSKRVNLAAIGRLIAGDSDGDASPPRDGVRDQFVLIIDEINRANISKVFGELITLIEPDKRLGMPNEITLTLPYSKKRDFGVPANLHIIGTMNTADRSIALLDTALRRRFVFREMAPDPSLLADVSRETGIDLVRVLTTINQRIEYLIDREHRIGHAFFIGCGSADEVHAAMHDKVIPLLQEYFFEDWSRIAAVLGSGFIGHRTLKCPLGEGNDRKSWFVRWEQQVDGSPGFPADAYTRLLSKSTSEVAEADAGE